MTTPERPFLDFYEKHSLIPTTLNYTDRDKFFSQRNFLFESIGISPHLLRGTKILELGPGTGQKAEHLLSLQPAVYVGVDNNAMSVNSTQNIINNSEFRGSASIKSSDFLDYEDAARYDLILAELVVPTQNNPQLFLEKLIKFLQLGGILIFTCSDSLALLSETLRRAIVKKLGLITEDIDSSAAEIVKFFELDLDSLHGMNRVRSDWAIDQMIKPTIGPQLSIPESLEMFDNQVKFHGSSPRFLEDYRWYKSPDSTVESLNKVASQNYWAKCHNFVDYRFVYEPRDSSVNKKLFTVSNFLYSVIQESEWTQKSEDIVSNHCEQILELISKDCSETSESLQSFLKFWKSNKLTDLQQFRSWWGRGTQYLSVIRTS